MKRTLLLVVFDLLLKAASGKAYGPLKDSRFFPTIL